MSDHIPCPKCYKWMPEHSLKNHWIHKKDHGEWNEFLERQGDAQAPEDMDIVLQSGVNREFEGLDFGDDYDGLQDAGTGEVEGLLYNEKDELEEDEDMIEFGEDIFGDGYNDFSNISHSLHEGMSGAET